MTYRFLEAWSPLLLLVVLGCFLQGREDVDCVLLAAVGVGGACFWAGFPLGI